MKEIKVVEVESKENINFELGDILKVEGIFGTSHNMIIVDENGQYQILDLSDMTIFKEVGNTPEEVVESIFCDERQDIKVLVVDKIITNPK